MDLSLGLSDTTWSIILIILCLLWLVSLTPMWIIESIKKLMKRQHHEDTPKMILNATRATTIRITSPITLPISDQALQEYSSEDYMNIFDNEVNERAYFIYTTLTEQCHVTPLSIKGTIVPADDASMIEHTQNIIIDCDIPADTPIDDIKNTLIQAFEEKYPMLY